MLLIKVSSDRTSVSETEFDPENKSYYCVFQLEVPYTREKMRWTNGPTDETCGDCIECLLALAQMPEYDALVYAGVSVSDGAHFSREMSYHVWRIIRILKWQEKLAGREKRCTDADYMFSLIRTRVQEPVHRRICTACFFPYASSNYNAVLAMCPPRLVLSAHTTPRW